MSENAIKLFVRVVLSLGLAAAGLFILTDNPTGNTQIQQAAAGWVGLVIGYWLR